MGEEESSVVVSEKSSPTPIQLPADVKAEPMDITSPRGAQCYCGEPRQLSHPDFQCCVCSRWFHKRCIKFNVGAVLPFMTNYHFMCKNCNHSKIEEVFNRKQANFAVMCQTAIANLIIESQGSPYHSVDGELIPYLETHWDALASQPRRQNKSWYTSIHKTVTSSDIFKTIKVPDTLSTSTDADAGFINMTTLSNVDFTKIGPNYDQFKALASGLKTDLSKLNVQVPGRNKRRAPGADMRGTRSRLEVERVKVNSQGYPLEHPFNKDNFRYILAEPDPHAPGRQQWDESEATSGKPIPGFFYRVWMPATVLLSMNDRAHQLKLSENQLQLSGEKGYCMARASHGVSKGTWYYEVEINEMPELAAARIGWSACLGNLQAPVGCDKFSYSWRSRMGTVFHQAKGLHYSDSGYSAGDVIGCLITLPGPTTVTLDTLFTTYKSNPLIKFKNCLYYEEKDEVDKSAKALRTHVAGSSEIRFYRNGEPLGVAFRKLFQNIYYPAISLYKSTQVTVNFGPDLKYPPTDVTDWMPMSARVDEQAVEQSLAEVIHNIDASNALDL